MPRSAATREFEAEAGRYRTQLMKYARTRLHNPAQAEDAVQDTLVAAMEGMERFAGDSSLSTWLTAILKHKMVDSVRAGAREAPSEAAPELLADERDGPEDLAWRSGLLRRLDRRLAALPAKASQVFVMRDVIGLSTAETCSELAISSANCAVLLHRARRRLRESLAADGIGIAA